ncbi:MAG: hypothetical protein MUF05_04790 [Candidatus Omnitrophica bacterium]|jgi:hypothetical protein|nr:hypothetical protein [Candidatus Omnitrophota bacterium]
MQKQDIKNLKKRYLVWFYKIAKEALDKVERKFTQAQVDRMVLKELRKNHNPGINRFIDDFEVYIANKEKAGLELKHGVDGLKDDYQFLCLKINAVEKTIISVLGKKALKEIKALYEKEMTERILKSTEH